MKKQYIFYFLLLFTTSLWAQIPLGYYDAASGQTGDALKQALNNIIKGHVEFPYTSTATDVWDILKISDRDPNNSNNVILLYTGWSVDAAQEYNDGAGWSREHVWAKSRGDFDIALGPGTDCHHLRPADISVNSARNNRWFAECDEQYFDDGGTIPTDSWTSSTDWIWKPRDVVKGDVARMIFYMSTRYEGFDGEPDLEVIDYLPADDYTLEPIHALLSDLLLWHQQDPVDDFERNRNEVVFGYQQNRNPFVDHPEYVDAIWGTATPPTDPPTTPQSISLTASTSSLSITWNDVSSEDGYYLYRSTDNTNFSVLATLGANTVSYDDSNVVEAQTYYYYVIAYNAYGNSAASSTVSGELSTSTGGVATDLFFSEYIEGSSYNKALEVSNFTGAALDLSHYVIKKQTNGAGDWSAGYVLSSTLVDGESYVVAHSSATQVVLDIADATTTVSELNFNGNDAVSLWKDGALIDLIGVFNDAANYAIDVTLIRNSDVASPNVVYTTGEWTSYVTDYFTDLGTHTFDGEVVPPPTCDVPTGLAVSNITITTADLSWTAVADAVEYSVQYKEAALSTWTTVVSASNSLSISGLSSDTQYEYQVATDCSAASSNYSASVLFTTEAVVIPPTCDVPTGLVVSNITITTADLSWTAVTDAVEYSVQYKEAALSTWTTVVSASNSLSLSGLTSETQYEFQVATDCSASSSTYSASVVFTTEADAIVISYCEPVGGTKFEWINYVELTNVSNTSGQSATGYSDFTNLIADVTLGQTYPITFQAGFVRRFYTEYWSVWIDFNQDGDFDDAGESLAQGSTTDDGLYYMDIAIPSDALLGETRLRIAMNDAGYFDACYNPKYGATEDYTVNIGTAKEALYNNLNAQKAEFIESEEFALYPNPAKDYIFVKAVENAQVEIYSATGQRVYKYSVSHDRIDVSELKSGIYFLRLDNGDKIKTQRFIKE